MPSGGFCKLFRVFLLTDFVHQLAVEFAPLMVAEESPLLEIFQHIDYVYFTHAT